VGSGSVIPKIERSFRTAACPSGKRKGEPIDSPSFKVHDRKSQVFDHSTDLILVLSQLLLKPAQQFILFAFGERQIIVGKIPVLLFKLTLKLVPGAFELKLSHKKLDVQKGGDIQDR
jgi:hypothetical protein